MKPLKRIRTLKQEMVLAAIRREARDDMGGVGADVEVVNREGRSATFANNYNGRRAAWKFLPRADRTEEIAYPLAERAKRENAYASKLAA